MLLELLQGNQDNQFKIEIVYFATTSIIDSFEDDGLNAKVKAYLTAILQFLTTKEICHQSFIIAKACLLFLTEIANKLKELPEFLPQIIRFIFQVFQNFGRLNTQSMRTLQEVMEYCKHNVSQDEVNLLRQFFNDNYNGLDLDCAKSLIQSLSLSVSAQSSL